MLEEETTRSTFSILIFVLGLNQIMLRHHQGLVLDHREAEDEEENVPGIHSPNNSPTNWTLKAIKYETKMASGGLRYRQCHRLPICFLTSDLTNRQQSETRSKEL